MPTYRLTDLCLVQDRDTSDFEYRGDPYRDICSVWAEITPIEQQATEEGERIQHVSKFDAFTRWNEAIKPGMSLLRMGTGERYNIETVGDTDGFRLFLRMELSQVG